MDWMVIVSWGLIVILVFLSATFSGLTLGLLSLDVIGLQIVIESGSPEESRYAKKIYPIRKRGNLLLCTLLLGNVAVNSLLSILMADFTSGLMGFLLSTIVIVIFGEIAPQATCSRYSLLIGSKAVPLVWVFLVLLFPASYPIAKILDWALGKEVGTIYSKNELKKLLDLHRTTQGVLSETETAIMSGALDFGQKCVKDIMTPISNVFMLPADQVLDLSTMTQILEQGYSRIPIYENDSIENIIGMLFVKDLALLNPEDATPIRTVLRLYNRVLPRMFDDTKLDAALAEFKKNRTHISLVQFVNTDGPGDPFYQVIGVVTLEDVLEEILQEEIIDETDIYVSNIKQESTGVRKDIYRKMSEFKRTQKMVKDIDMIDGRQVNEIEREGEVGVGGGGVGVGVGGVGGGMGIGIGGMANGGEEKAMYHLTEFQIEAIVSFLGNTVKYFSNILINENILRRLIMQSKYKEMSLDLEQWNQLQQYGRRLQPKDSDWIYKREKNSNVFTLILSGKVEVTSGVEGFKTEAGQFCYIGVRALTQREFKPDFSARIISQQVNLLQIPRTLYENSLKATLLQKNKESISLGGGGGGGGGGLDIVNEKVSMNDYFNKSDWEMIPEDVQILLKSFESNQTSTSTTTTTTTSKHIPSSSNNQSILNQVQLYDDDGVREEGEEMVVIEFDHHYNNNRSNQSNGNEKVRLVKSKLHEVDDFNREENEEEDEEEEEESDDDESSGVRVVVTPSPKVERVSKEKGFKMA